MVADWFPDSDFPGAVLAVLVPGKLVTTPGAPQRSDLGRGSSGVARLFVGLMGGGGNASFAAHSRRFVRVSMGRLYALPYGSRVDARTGPNSSRPDLGRGKQAG